MSVISKDSWVRVAFGEVVRLTRERSADPEADGLYRYVGLEHIESGDLKIRRWGETANGTTFTNVFRAGQVLFGKRRAYQRKVAVADFDGVCSGDIYVLEPKSAQLAPELLPFICQTDGFFEHAVGTSAGSLSPRTNWDSLASYEFALPPLDEQRLIADVLEAARGVVDHYRSVTTSSRVLRQSVERRTLIGGVPEAIGNNTSIEDIRLPPRWQLVAASKLCSVPITSGSTPRKGEVRSQMRYPFIKVGNLTFDGQLDFGAEASHVNRAAFDETSSLHVFPGDVLTNIVGPPLGKVSVVPSGFPEALINQAIVRYRATSPEIGIWLRAYLMSSWAKRWLFLRSKKTSGQRNINATTCADLPVPVPPEAQLLALVARLEEARTTSIAMSDRATGARELLTLLVHEAMPLNDIQRS